MCVNLHMYVLTYMYVYKHAYTHTTIMYIYVHIMQIVAPLSFIPLCNKHSSQSYLK